jgi:hypothetical protein
VRYEYGYIVRIGDNGCGAHFVPDLDSCHLPVEENEEVLQTKRIQEYAHKATLTYTALDGYGAIRVNINLNKRGGTVVHVHNSVYEVITDPISF